jgi:hypothetical protein
VWALARLATEPEEKAEARRALVDHIIHITDPVGIHRLTLELLQLDPTPADLIASRNWIAPSSDGLVRATRQNSSLDQWGTVGITV